MTAMKYRFSRLVLLVAFLWSGAVAAEPPAVSAAWLRPPAVAGRPGALYFTLTNPGPATAIVAVKTPIAGRAELHAHDMANGIMRMRKVERVELPAGGQVMFQPHGYHVMLFNLDEAKLGTATVVSFTLILEGGANVAGQAAVKR